MTGIRRQTHNYLTLILTVVSEFKSDQMPRDLNEQETRYLTRYGGFVTLVWSLEFGPIGFLKDVTKNQLRCPNTWLRGVGKEPSCKIPEM